jgi:GNAT superfamily N-acetyltransferase
MAIAGAAKPKSRAEKRTALRSLITPQVKIREKETGTAIINEGCLFLFLVATMPEARRKGYGEAVVRHALQTAYEATGISRTVLHATEAGHPLYLRLGYHPTVKFMGCMLGS